MSDDVNKDIDRAIQAAKANSGDSNTKSEVVIPPPRTLQHGLNQDGGVVLSSPQTLIAEVRKDED